jgi:ferredoxin
MADRQRVPEISQGDLDVDPMLPELPRIAHQDPYFVALGEQPRQELSPDHAGCSREEDHAATVASPPWLPAESRAGLECRLTRRPLGAAIATPPWERKKVLAYVIAEPCIGEKDNSCVEVCPVDCIHPTPDEAGYDKVEQLFIDPDECIDCDACVEACPVDACFAEDQLPDEWSKYTQINLDYYKANA